MQASMSMETVHCQAGMFCMLSCIRFPMTVRIRVMGMTSYSASAAGAVGAASTTGSFQASTS